MSIGKHEIRNRFSQHPSTQETLLDHDRAREAFILLGDFIDELLPDGRAKSTAMTKLQETSMWVNFGIAEQVPLNNQAGPRPTPPAA